MRSECRVTRGVSSTLRLPKPVYNVFSARTRSKIGFGISKGASKPAATGAKALVTHDGAGVNDQPGANPTGCGDATFTPIYFPTREITLCMMPGG